MDINKAQAFLGRLIGLPLWSAGRAGNLEWFHFGAQHIVVDEFDGTEKLVGDYALHVQCAWRIAGPTGIEVGSDDLYYPATSEAGKDLANFDWDRQGKNRCDERISALIASHDLEPLRVTDVDVDFVGSVKLKLNGNYILEVFPYSSLPLEQWRLFQPYEGADQLVLTGRGFEG